MIAAIWLVFVSGAMFLFTITALSICPKKAMLKVALGIMD